MKGEVINKAPFGWRSGKVGGWKSGRMENIVVFPLMCLVGGVEKWEDKKLFCFVGEKKGKDGKCNLCKLTIIPLLHNIVDTPFRNLYLTSYGG